MAELHQNIENIFHRCWSNKEKICEERVTEHMLAYIFSGEMIVFNGTRRVTIHKGEAAFIRRNHLVDKIKQPTAGQPFNGVFLHLESSFLRRMSQQLKFPAITENGRLMKQLYIPIQQNPFITGYFRSLDQYFIDGKHPSVPLMELKLQEVVQILIEQMPELIPILFDYTKEWKPDLEDFMSHNYTNDLSLEQFAHYTGRSLSTFKRDFTAIYNETPSRWVMHRRLEEAKRLIDEEGQRPNDIYDKVGFKNLSHFSTAFKRQYGFPPTQNI